MKEPEQAINLLQAAEAAWKAAIDGRLAGGLSDAHVCQIAIDLTCLALDCMKSWSGQIIAPFEREDYDHGSSRKPNR